MTPELFVGPLRTYYEGSWRVPTPPFVRPELRPDDTQMVRMYHYKFSADGELPPEPPAAQTELQTLIETWRDHLNQTFASILAAPLAWDEAEKTSGAAQPDLHALKVWAASSDQPEIRNTTEWRSMDVRSVASQGAMVRFSQILEAPDLWLPAAFDFSIKADDPMGNPAVLGSTSSLWRQIEDLNDLFWRAPAREIETWNLVLPGTEAPLEKVVRYSFCELFLATEVAVKNHLPMKFDD